ncbi:MAG: 4Fe-4S ferredoxin [Candidatus Meridianibacter frigidus]|nr:MAG: 4Fe-4S ferredoxin [Candidatus Eremiobacteraeota bacterium]
MSTGFFTDTTLCIGCKACEVACKQWNELPSDGFEFTGESYDNTTELSATTWRHVSFSEKVERKPELPYPQTRWLMSSDVCKHCTHAGCLEACPTGAIIRNEFGNVYIQPDVCNGCGYCVPACPFGVVDLMQMVGGKDGDPKYNTNVLRADRMEHTAVQAIGGIAGKCTLCYDRQRSDLEPACSKACPTESIQFGDLDELRERARKRVEQLQGRQVQARLYGVDENWSVGTLGAFFLLTDAPAEYDLPERPVLPSTHQPAAYASAAVAATALFLIGSLIFTRS